MKILLVDDSAFMRNLIKNALKEGNHEFNEAGSAEEGVKKYAEFHPELVFMDIVMPGKTGIDALREIKAADTNARVVMCTSVGGQQKIIDDAVSAGASDFVTKPFKAEELITIVSHFQKK